MSRALALLYCGSLAFSAASLSAEPPRESFKLDALLALRGYEATVEEHLNGVLNGLKALAATRDAMSGEWDRIDLPLARFGTNVPSGAAFWFAKPDGSYFTAEKGRVDQNLEDRSYFSEIMKGRDVIGNLVISKSTGERSVIVATPILADGHIVGVLGASLSAKRIATLVSDEIGFPDNIVFYALDTEGLTALHKDASLIFEFPSDIGDQSLKSAVQKMLSEPEGEVRYRFRDTDRIVIFHRSRTTGWTFALGTIST